MGVIGNETERSDLDVGGKPHMGENPRNEVGTENLINIQGFGLRWDSNRGPQRWKAGKETTHWANLNAYDEKIININTTFSQSVIYKINVERAISHL